MDTAASPVRPDFTRVLDKAGNPISFTCWLRENLEDLSMYYLACGYYLACDPGENYRFMDFCRDQYVLQDSIDQDDPYTKDDYDADEADSKYDGRDL